MAIKELALDPARSPGDQEKVVKECINEAMQKMQQLMAQKMAGLMQ